MTEVSEEFLRRIHRSLLAGDPHDQKRVAAEVMGVLLPVAELIAVPLPVEQAMGAVIDDARVILGDFDHVVGRKLEGQLGRDLRFAFLLYWGRRWDVRRTLTAPTQAQRLAWSQFAKQDVKPSDIWKGCAGMTHDPWPERCERRDWKYIANDLDRWLDLYAKHEGQRDPIHGPGRTATKTYDLDGVALDHPPTDTDKQLSAMGYVWSGGQWRDPTSENFAAWVAQNGMPKLSAAARRKVREEQKRKEIEQQYGSGE